MRRISSASRRIWPVDHNNIHGVLNASFTTPPAAWRLLSRSSHRPSVARCPPLLRDRDAAVSGFRRLRCDLRQEKGGGGARFRHTLSPFPQQQQDPLLSRNPALSQRTFSSKSPSGDGNGNKNKGKDAPDIGQSGKSDAPINRDRTKAATAPGSATAPAPAPASAPAASTGVSRGSVPATRGDGKAKGGLGGSGGGLPHQVSEFYAEMERNLMSRMHAQDKRRFRAIGLSSLLLFVWVLSMFGTEIRKYFASQTAEVARETLKVEALQVQTQELATALVQALLNDQEVVGAGALFLREASTNPETQAALVSLALFVLQHRETLDETIVLAKKLVQAILDDPESVQQVTALALKVMADERFMQGATQLVVELGESEEVLDAVAKLSSRVIQDPEVQATLSSVLTSSSHEVLEDQEVLDHSKEFVAQVIGDDAVQRSGGDALWNTVQYALRTRVMRVTGLCLLVGSAVLLSGRVPPLGGLGFGGGGVRD